ncbi:hypothetical protein J2Z21_005854 [Streptomyces griseochromogenes]|uniref:Uncharacterized protein n=1 Tax=Streptomyces griseochromogenes TaxID=68214 RepID=A0ABS4LZN4_9ACTN|nr:hypothetical protein [Streptomyces griseochromogenes]
MREGRSERDAATVENPPTAAASRAVVRHAGPAHAGDVRARAPVDRAAVARYFRPIAAQAALYLAVQMSPTV